jgi:hypothetical protein
MALIAWEILKECSRRAITLRVENGRLQCDLHPMYERVMLTPSPMPKISAKEFIDSVVRPHETQLVTLLGRAEGGCGYGMKELEEHFLRLSWTATNKTALNVALNDTWRLAHKRGYAWFALRMAVRSYAAALSGVAVGESWGQTRPVEVDAPKTVY